MVEKLLKIDKQIHHVFAIWQYFMSDVRFLRLLSKIIVKLIFKNKIEKLKMIILNERKNKQTRKCDQNDTYFFKTTQDSINIIEIGMMCRLLSFSWSVDIGRPNDYHSRKLFILRRSENTLIISK